MNFRWGPAIPLLVTALVFLIGPAWAHPLGNFTINHYAAIDARPDGLGIAYVLDMAEIPTFQEIGRLDQAGLRRHVTARVVEWSRNVHLSADGVSVPLTLRAARVACIPGAGGLPILRIEEDLSAEAPLSRTWGVDARRTVQYIYRDANFPERVGWKEIVVAGPYVTASSVPATDRGSARLRNYPADLLTSPPDDSTARFSVRPSAVTSAAASPAASSAVAPPFRLELSRCRGRAEAAVGSLGGSGGGPRYAAESTAFGALYTRLVGSALSLRVLIAGLLGAFLLGAYHAMMPGHGKAILAAYFIGSRGTPAQAVLLGTLVTLTHTTGVFLLGFGTLIASGYVLPETLYPWLSVLSGAALSVVGASLFVRRLNERGRFPQSHHHDHRNDGGHHHHDFSDTSAHHHHLALPAGAIRSRDLITLGVTGGMLPCPSALIVMLAAISAGQVGFGLALITAFSIGLATVLTVGGLLMLYGRAFVTRLVDGVSGGQTPQPWRQRARLLSRQLPVVSAAVVAVLGLLIVVQTVLAMGRFR